MRRGTGAPPSTPELSGFTLSPPLAQLVELIGLGGSFGLTLGLEHFPAELRCLDRTGSGHLRNDAGQFVIIHCLGTIGGGASVLHGLGELGGFA